MFKGPTIFNFQANSQPIKIMSLIFFKRKTTKTMVYYELFFTAKVIFNPEVAKYDKNPSETITLPLERASLGSLIFFSSLSDSNS